MVNKSDSAIKEDISYRKDMAFKIFYSYIKVQQKLIQLIQPWSLGSFNMH
jgi:hypothetical protein